MSNRREIDDIAIRNGKYVTKSDSKEFSGTMVSRYSSGKVSVETKVNNGQMVGSTSYNQKGAVISKTESPLASKQKGVSYKNVSDQYRNYKTNTLENSGYFIGIFVIIIVVIIAIFKISGRAKV
jgi:hypothetical protein